MKLRSNTIKYNHQIDYIKLRSGKIVAMYKNKINIVKNDTIPKKIKKELIESINIIKNFFIDNEKVADTIVQKSLMVGKGVYINEIKKCVNDFYLTPDNIHYYVGGTDAYGALYTLPAIISGDHRIVRKEINSLQNEEQKNYQKFLRDQIEEYVYKCYFGDDNELMGEHTKINDDI